MSLKGNRTLQRMKGLAEVNQTFAQRSIPADRVADGKVHIAYGEPDPSGTNSEHQKNLNAEIERAYASGDARLTSRGTAIELPPGIFKINTPIKLRPGTQLSGSGEGLTVIWQTADDQDCIQCDTSVAYSNQQIVIENMLIRGSTTATAGALINLIRSSDTTYATVRNVMLYEGYDGLIVNDGINCVFERINAYKCNNIGFTSTGNLNASVFRECYAHECGSHGYYFTGAKSYNRLEGCGSDNNVGHGYYINTGCRQLTFDTCGTEGCKENGFYVLGGNGLIFENCTAYECGDNGFQFHSSDNLALISPYTVAGSTLTTADCTTTAINVANTISLKAGRNVTIGGVAKVINAIVSATQFTITVALGAPPAAGVTVTYGNYGVYFDDANSTGVIINDSGIAGTAGAISGSINGIMSLGQYGKVLLGISPTGSGAPIDATSPYIQVKGGDDTTGQDTTIWLRNEQTNIDWTIFNDSSASDILNVYREAVRHLTLSTKGIRIFQATSDPTSPVEGDMYYNTTAHTLKIYNGTAWKTVTMA